MKSIADLLNCINSIINTKKFPFDPTSLLRLVLQRNDDGATLHPISLPAV